MSSTVLERLRSSAEISERYETAIGVELDIKPNGQKHKIVQQHKIASLINAITNTNNEIINIINDNDNILNDEINIMKDDDMFNHFYNAINTTYEYHSKYPNIVIDNNDNIIKNLVNNVNVDFSGEEVFGKYLDLHSFHYKYCNLPNISNSSNSSSGAARSSSSSSTIDYIQYLEKFNSFFYINENHKTNKYTTYINELLEYLYNFFNRVQPLVNMNEILSSWEATFDELWADGKINGWTLKSNAKVSNKQPQPLKLTMFNASEELESLGNDRLKEACEALGIKCGGTIHDRALRLWSIRDKKPDEIPQKLRVKETKTDNTENISNKKKIAWVEYQIISLTEIIIDIVIATRKHAEKQQTRNIDEKHNEIFEEEYGALADVNTLEEIDDKEDDGPIYNPLNLPLGWDGKPIAYWLYKLHGLSQEFNCEICGNVKYQGRRNFDRHFQEWRHSHGMRCLGVPNTKHFHDIVLIEDVLTLFAKIKNSLKSGQFVNDVDEEFEDTEGNVLNRRIYEDLARQGLL